MAVGFAEREFKVGEHTKRSQSKNENKNRKEIVKRCREERRPTLEKVRPE
jgi:hypothetical protein